MQWVYRMNNNCNSLERKFNQLISWNVPSRNQSPTSGLVILQINWFLFKGQICLGWSNSLRQPLLNFNVSISLYIAQNVVENDFTSSLSIRYLWQKNYEIFSRSFCQWNFLSSILSIVQLISRLFAVDHLWIQCHKCSRCARLLFWFKLYVLGQWMSFYMKNYACSAHVWIFQISHFMTIICDLLTRVCCFVIACNWRIMIWRPWSHNCFQAKDLNRLHSHLLKSILDRI